MNNFERLLQEGKFKDAAFKAFFSITKEEVKDRVKQSSTDFLQQIVKGGGFKGQGGPQKIQFQAAKKELDRRKRENDPGPKSGPLEHGK